MFNITQRVTVKSNVIGNHKYVYISGLPQPHKSILNYLMRYHCKSWIYRRLNKKIYQSLNSTCLNRNSLYAKYVDKK